MIEITNELLIKSLLFITVFTITFQVFTKIFKDKKISLIIAASISILSLFYLSRAQESFIGASYGILGIILLISLPAFVVFYFLYSSVASSTIRKSAWIAYGAMSVFILGKNGTFSSEITSLAIISLIIILVGILFFDKKIREKINTNKHLRPRR